MRFDVYAFIIFVWNLEIYNLVSYSDDFRVWFFANTCIEKFDVQIKIVFRFILLLQIINYIHRAAPPRAVHVLVIDSNFPRQYALETHTHNNPFTLAKSLKGKGGMYMLLQRRNCTHSTSNSCFWVGAKWVWSKLILVC